MVEDRRLAAIMFTDIVGYTKLMGSDEDKAFDMLNRNHTIHETLIKKHNGTLIKEIGDGTLASFPLASNAVRCAMDIQKEAKSSKIPLKIGIHQGEMVMAGADVLGDGVNIASRLQEASQEGCITISGKVYSDIRNKAGIKAEYIEEQYLKNVEDPIKVYKVLCEEKEKEEQIPFKEEEPKKGRIKTTYYIIGGLVLVFAAIFIWYNLPESQTDPPTREVILDKEISIAVLPFDNLSGDPNQEVMCDGLTEEIIHYLSIIKIFDKVISRSSVMTFKDSEKTVPEIAGLLNVNFILEGSYRQSGNRLRITAQLIEASSDNHLWTEIYEQPTGDIFDIQSDIAKKIASNLKGELSTGENVLIEKKPTDNLEAYNLYLRGRFFWHQRTEENLKKSVYYFNQALELDSTYALAYAGLADAYFIMAWWGWYPESEGYEISKSFAEKALLIDDQIAQAHATLGVLLFWDERKLSEAEKALKMAIELNPSYATGHQYYAELLHYMGRIEEARKEIDLAIKYNPYSVIMHNLSGWWHHFDGHYKEALKDVLLMRELDENTTLGGLFPFYSYLYLGKHEEAVKELQFVLPKTFDKTDTLEIRDIYLDSGIDGIIRWLIDYHTNLENPSYLELARLNMFIDKKEAIRWLEIGYNKNYKWIRSEIKYFNEFNPLHSHPRFIALLKKMELDREGI